MHLRRPLGLPITLAVVMFTLLVVLTVGWVLLNVFGGLANDKYAAVYWVLLSIGSMFIVFLIVGVALYLGLTIKAINLTRRQSNFVDSVTHELKSPIASLKLYLQTLHRRRWSDEEQADFHRFMMEDVERLDHLINQVLDAGRLDAGYLDGAMDQVALSPLLCECAEMVCLRYRVPPDTVHWDLQPYTVRGRRFDLDIIFRNLLDNAIKYAGPAPRVEVIVRRGKAGTVVVQAATTGRASPRGAAAEDLRPVLPHRRRIGAGKTGHRTGAVHRAAVGSPSGGHGLRGGPPRPRRSRVRSSIARRPHFGTTRRGE